MQGYIKLYRKMLNWEWYTDIPVRIIFEHCLLKANHKGNKWQGQIIDAGSFITSYEKLSIETGLTVQQVRTALNKLKSTGEITYKSTSRYSMITVKNWIEYQEDNTQNNKQITNKQQTNNKQITTNKNDKNDKNDKNEENNIVEIKGINSKENKKTDPFNNSIIRFFKDEYFKIFNNKPYLTAIERNKIIELCADIEDFKETIPIVLGKMKDIDFGFENWKPTASWLLKDSNYTTVLNGTYDKQNKRTVFDELRERERVKNGTT